MGAWVGTAIAAMHTGWEAVHSLTPLALCSTTTYTTHQAKLADFLRVFNKGKPNGVFKKFFANLDATSDGSLGFQVRRAWCMVVRLAVPGFLGRVKQTPPACSCC